MKKLLITFLSVLMLVACAIGIAACGKVEFKLSFIVDGEVYASIDTSGDEVITMPDEPKKEDYIFDGWYWDKDTWQRPFTANSLLNEPISSDMSVYAKWLEEDITKRSYTVSFNSFGGSAVSDVTVQYGKLLTEPSEPARTGYVFVGWYKDADLKTEWDFAFDTVTEDITLYAKWVDESDATGCDILSADGFEVDGNTLSVKVPNAQEHFALSEAITVSPYAEWTVTSDITGNAEIPSATVPLAVGDNTYYINVVSGNGSNKKQYTVEIRRRDIYTVTYSFSNGSADVTEQVEEDGKAPFKSAVKTGYTFDCWKNDSSAWDFENDVISGDTTLTASWTANTYDVTFDSNGGDTITASTATYDVAFEFTVPVRNGYTFSGWKTEGGTKLTDSTGKSIGVWNIAADTTLYADWSATEYSVVYNNMDGATNSNPAKYTVEDDTITLANAEKTGYTFLGWYSDSSMTSEVKQIDTSAAVNVELWAKWDVIEYTATFRNSDGVVDTVKFTVEDKTITEPKVPERNGYTGAWETYELTADDLTINAVYTPVTYTITYTNTKDAENVNATQFTVESETIKLADLSVNGYTFNGWYNGDEKVTEITTGTYGNIALEARWTPVVYTITYEYDDTVGNLPDGVTLKTSYTIEDAFDFASLNCNSVGYNFAGWFTEKELGTGEQVTGIALGTTGNKTYYAQWGLETYSITFENVEGAVNTNPDTYTIESATFTLSNVSKTGYLFEGWYTDAQFSSPAQTTIELGSHGDRTFYAKWSLVSYSITYNLYGGSYEGAENPASYDIETEVKLVAPVLEGSFFAGWYTLSEGGALTTEIPEGTTGNITLYARWITFESNGGSKVKYDLQYSEDGITPPAAPEKDYYVFAGWYLDAQFETAYDFNTLPQSTCTLYAKWTPVEYTINYVLNGGTNNDSNPATYTVEDAVTFAAPSKTGYTFNGWYSNAQFTGVLVEGITLGSHGEITLYASFSVNEYTITFNANGGTTVAAITQNYGTEVTAPASPSKTGYRFAGWYADAELKTPYAFTTIPAEDITVYAAWTLVEYEIVYNLDGGTNDETNPVIYNIESKEIVFAAPSKLGYEFAGWFSDVTFENAVTSLPAGSYGEIELFAKWDIIEYEIEYVTADGTVNENAITYTVETDVTELLNAILKGHTFNGWYSNADYTNEVTTFGGGSVGDITLYAKFTANTYDVWLDGSDAATATVTFDLNGANGTAPAAQTVTETDTLVYPEVPERSGYIFGGWYANKDCEGELYDFSGLVGGDITLYAKWVKTGSADGGININDSVTFDLKGTAEQKYIFIPLVSGNVSITTTGSIDTLGTLYKDGVLLKQDDDSAADGKNFLIVYNVTAGEVYEIRVRGFSTNTDGSVILSIAGTYKVADGGYAQAGNKVTVTYGSHFTLPVPEGGELQKFLGWQDENGVMYTDGSGASIRVWDKDGAATLFSKWERMEYTITFVTSGGSEIASVTLEYGARVDINEYVTTRSGYTFAGWYLDGAEYNATTMPDHNITLTARWVTFSLGSIKYDTDKKAISINDEITAELFEAICLDTNGKLANFTVSVSGTQAVGETITVRLVATSGNKTKQITITDVKVYGMPTLTFDNTVEYVNVVGGMTATHFGASGLDTFGASTDIKVYIDGEYTVGTDVKIVIEAIDVAGNITYGYVENVKAYGLPVISYNDAKAEIKTNDKINAELFNATAVDSFGAPLSVTVTKYSGTISAGNTVVIRITATDSKGNVTNIDVECDVYGVPTISNASKTDVKVSDTVTPELLGITATDTYDNPLVVILSTKQGSQTAGVVWVVTATVTDVAGNVATKDFNLKVYGAPNITYDRDGVNVTENAAADSYAISFDLNGGNGSIASQTVTTTVGLVYPEIPTRSGYVFKGWYTTADCTTLFDFSANVTKDTTVYAGWHPMTTSGAGSEVMLVYGDNNSSSDYYSLSTKGTSSSNALYTYFAILKDGTYKLYYKNGTSSASYRTYIEVYNETQQTTIKSNTYISSISFSYVSFTAKAGDVIYVRNYRYSTSSSSYYTTFSMYLNGAVTPTAGGLIPATGAHRILNANATDSFGNALTVNATLKSGTLTVGTYVVYTLTATDHLGNTYSMDTEPLGVYDPADIKLEYSAGMSDLIKLASKGEEFGAKATDSFGNLCEISIEAAEGYTLVGGNTISLYIVATDKAGNKEYSELISDIKVYDLPEIICKRTDTIDMDSDPSFFFQVNDSFGEELYFTTTVIGEMKVGNYVDIKLVVSDDAGHYIEKLFTDYYVKESDKVLIKFVHSDDTEELLLLNRDGKNFPTRELEGWQYVWTSEPNNEGTVYDGTFQIEDDYLVLYAEFIKTVNLSLNSGTYTGSTTITAIYQDSYSFGIPKRSNYEFLGWYDANSGGTMYVNASGHSVFDSIEQDFPSTLYARWARIYTISYNLNGGTKPSYNYPTKYTEGRSYSLGTPTKTGYDFGGWYTNSSLTNKITSITSTTTGNLTLYAKWTAKTYTITLQTAGTISTKTYKVSYDSTYTLPVPTRSGYTFLGWRLSDATATSVTIPGTSYKASCTMLVAKSTGASVSAYTYTENKTYSAVWQNNVPAADYASGGTMSGSGSYTDVLIGKGSYKFTWTIGNPGTDKSFATLGGVKFTTKTGTKTFTISTDDRVYSLSVGVFVTGYGSSSSQTGTSKFTKTS